ncbi:proline-, glutamic acid- and leucine-rich protein 1 [Drosophila bipectinata]|uniref:proline-, glutamic acid- and leucine-rich protein 1 n=1 Tax=Drosophila bipectinata TaxID=42026 RepID=UPI001C8B0926|nr:proline-, glutamic acid- and leucine-rich protein 1 [Drosophila bipectinata]
MEKILTATLKKRESRGLGFRLLICHLSKKDTELADKTGNIWLTLTFQSCNATELNLYGDLIFSGLALLIKKIQHDSNLSKTFTSTYLVKVFDIISRKEVCDNQSCTLAALKTIKLCLEFYPRTIKSGKVPIEKFLLNSLDSNNKDVVSKAGECWLLLQNVRGPSNQGNNNDKLIWQNYQTSLLKNLNTVLKENFALSKDTLESCSSGPFPITVAKDPLERTSQNFRRFLNLVEFLKIALRKPFGNKKLINTQQILSFIGNGLSVDGVKKINAHIDNVCFGIYLTEVKIKLLELLETLIDVCHTHLRMDFRVILNVLLDSLENTKTLLSTGNRSQSDKVRSVVYRVISKWCATLQEGSHCEIISETLVKEILEDIRQSPDKRKNPTQAPKNQQSGTISALELLQGNEDKKLLLGEAFNCLQKLLSSSGHLLKVSLLKDVHSSLLGICSRMHSDPVRKRHLPVVWNCRLETYKAFVFLLKARNNNCPPPSEIYLSLLSQSIVFGNNTKLRQSFKALAEDLEPYLHPQKININFKRTFELKHSIGLDQENNLPENSETSTPILELLAPPESSNEEIQLASEDTQVEETSEVNEVDATRDEEELPEDQDATRDLETSGNIENGDSEAPSEILETKPNGNLEEDMDCESYQDALEHSENINSPQNIGSPDKEEPVAETTSQSPQRKEEQTPMDLELLDEDRIIAELEASFVNELK